MLCVTCHKFFSAVSTQKLILNLKSLWGQKPDAQRVHHAPQGPVLQSTVSTQADSAHGPCALSWILALCPKQCMFCLA